MGWGYLWKFITVVLVLVLLLIPEVTLGKSLAFSGLSSPTIEWGVRINWSENFVSLDLINMMQMEPQLHQIEHQL